MILRSPYPDVSIPDQTLTAFVLEHAAERADKPALIDGPSGRTLTYAGLADGVRRMAGGLARHGVNQGDVVALFAPNMPEWAVAFHGIASLGAVVTTINSLATSEEIERQLRDSGSRFLITIPPFLDRAAEPARAAGLREVFVFGEADGATPVASLLAEDAQPPLVSIAPADFVALPYSSGTTGFAKGVMLSHRNLVANVLQTGAGQGVREDETLIAILPFFHIYGMTVILNLGLRHGATIVTMPKFELEPFLQVMAQRRVTRAFLVPPIVLALAKQPAVDRYDLSALQLILSGAAPLDASLANACSTRLGCEVMQGYGLTETSPVTVITSDRPGMSRPGSIGTLAPNTQAMIVDVATSQELGTGADGEICFRGPQVMQGYLGNPEATAQTIDAAGWLHTGDIGHVDADGYFFIVDRLKELIKYKGYQVPPAELEALLLSHPAVADAAVIPIPDEEAGEIPKAFVVLADEAFDAQELMPYVAEHVAPYKRIRQLEVIDAIPKSASGKILRRVLVERERAAVGVGPPA
jgi:acyl-CoA synthetase (AMP-forming)/AMP-acid ligase II